MEKLAFLFTGQGSQFVGMAKSFYNDWQIARDTFEEASDILGFDMARLCFEGSLSDLTRTENAQPAILTTSVVAFRVYMQEIGIAPQFCAGHSLGEYSALTCSGAVKFSDALQILRYRGYLAKEAAENGIGGMTIVDSVEQGIIEEECRKVTKDGSFVMINCYNAPVQFAIAGHQNTLESVEGALLERGAQITPLFASAPFHSPLMQSVCESLKEELKKYRFFQFRYPVISNVTGRPYGESSKIAETLCMHMVRPVRWQATMKCLKKYGVTHTIEMGPKNVLTNLVKANTPDINAFCYSQKEDRVTLNELFNNHPFKKHIPTVVTRCMAAAVATPNSNFNKEEYEKGVIEPYRKIQKIQEKLDRESSTPDIFQMKEALEHLQTIFTAKILPIEEQTEWFCQILDETGTYYLQKEFTSQLKLK